MLESQNGSAETTKSEADYTICDKVPVSETSVENMSVNGTSVNDTADDVDYLVDYLFDQGKCRKICKTGKKINLWYFYKIVFG